MDRTKVSKYEIRPPRDQRGIIRNGISIQNKLDNLQYNFHVPTVKECMREVLMDELNDKTYNSQSVSKWTSDIAKALCNKIKDLGYVRYKLVAQVIIGEQRGAGFKAGSSCLWDADTDTHATEVLSNDSLFCVATVYGIYYY